MSAGKVHNFAERLAFGQRGEKDLDFFFSQWHQITPATPAEQRDGIDRHFTGTDEGHFTVEYKTDARADQTGNIFVEIVSVDTRNIPGGHIRSKADRLIIYLPKSELIYILQASHLRDITSTWSQRYRHGFARNEGYTTEGVLVPQSEFERESMVLNMADYKHWLNRSRKKDVA